MDLIAFRDTFLKVAWRIGWKERKIGGTEIRGVSSGLTDRWQHLE